MLDNVPIFFDHENTGLSSGKQNIPSVECIPAVGHFPPVPWYFYNPECIFSIGSICSSMLCNFSSWCIEAFVSSCRQKRFEIHCAVLIFCLSKDTGDKTR